LCASWPLDGSFLVACFSPIPGPNDPVFNFVPGILPPRFFPRLTTTETSFFFTQGELYRPPRTLSSSPPVVSDIFFQVQAKEGPHAVRRVLPYPDLIYEETRSFPITFPDPPPDLFLEETYSGHQRSLFAGYSYAMISLAAAPLSSGFSLYPSPK